jgi:hypothetical protein
MFDGLSPFQALTAVAVVANQAFWAVDPHWSR